MEKLKKYSDLYGSELTFLHCAKKFRFISYCKNSIPAAGSMTKKTACLFHASFENIIIEKIINHRSGNITIKTNNGYYQFLN